MKAVFSNPNSKSKESSKIALNPNSNFPWIYFLPNMVEKVQNLVFSAKTSLVFGQLYKQLKMLISKVHVLYLPATLKRKSEASSKYFLRAF